MSFPEGLTVGVVVGAAVVFVARQFSRSMRAEKGSCKGCGDSCSCAVSAIHKSSPSDTAAQPKSGTPTKS